MPLVPHARINSFFSLKKIDASNLPDDVPPLLPELDAVVDQLSVEPVIIVPEKNVPYFFSTHGETQSAIQRKILSRPVARSYHSVYDFLTEQSSSICYQTNNSQYCLRRRDERACYLRWRSRLMEYRSQEHLKDINLENA